MTVPDLDPTRAPPLLTAAPITASSSSSPAVGYKGPIQIPGSIARHGGALRWMIGAARGGLLLIVAVGALEMILPAPYKISGLIGSFQGAVDSAELAKKQAEQAKFDAAVAAARAEGERSVTAKYEGQIATLNRDLEITSTAYQTLYQRSNALAQGYIQIQTQMLQFRQQAIARTQGGAAAAANISGFFCGLGMITGDESDSSGFCAGSRRVQNQMAEEVDQRGVSYEELSTALFGGLPDPATMRVSEDQRLQGNAAVTSPPAAMASSL